MGGGGEGGSIVIEVVKSQGGKIGLVGSVVVFGGSSGRG